MKWFFMLIFIGVFLWLANLHIVSLARDWPVILIVIGFVSLVDIFKKGKKNRILSDLESGKISVEDAEKKLRKS